MSNFFDPARQGLVQGEIVWKEGASVIKADLVRGYAYSIAHKFRSEMLAAGGVVVSTATLTSLSVSATGVFRAANTVWAAVPEGPPIPYLVIYQASAVTGGADLDPSQQRLIIFEDRGQNIPINTPNGQNITSAWSPGADGIARI